jgi:hypothetical protein
VSLSEAVKYTAEELSLVEVLKSIQELETDWPAKQKTTDQDLFFSSLNNPDESRGCDEWIHGNISPHPPSSQ